MRLFSNIEKSKVFWLSQEFKSLMQILGMRTIELAMSSVLQTYCNDYYQIDCFF